MGTFWLVVCLLLAGLAIAQSVLTGVQAWEHRRFARGRLRSPLSGPPGRAVLLVPCRGLDPGLEENLRAILVQDRRDYAAWFIVESPHDPVYPAIRRVINEHPGIESRVIFAGRANGSGQKVHNLLVATAEIPRDVKYLIFVDSDARPEPRWLGGLLQRLDCAGVGAATGYRWFVPQRPTLANHLLYSLNCSVALLLGKHTPHFVWGGSWAIRRDTFERLRIREAWQGTLSDDLVASRALRRARLRIEFEPACMVASPLDNTFHEMVSFVRRQYTIGRFYVPGTWAIGFTWVTLANLVFLGGLGAIVCGLLTGTPPPRSTSGGRLCGSLPVERLSRPAAPGRASGLLSRIESTARQRRPFRRLGGTAGRPVQLASVGRRPVAPPHHLAGNHLSAVSRRADPAGPARRSGGPTRRGRPGGTALAGRPGPAVASLPEGGLTRPLFSSGARFFP